MIASIVNNRVSKDTYLFNVIRTKGISYVFIDQ